MQQATPLLPMRWLNADGFHDPKTAEHWRDMLAEYKAKSHDVFSLDDLMSELTATVREQGAVFVILDEQRNPAGYMCVKLIDTSLDRSACVTQWYKRPGLSAEWNNNVTKEFFRVLTEFAKSNRCRSLRVMTYVVGPNGAISPGLFRMLKGLGFKATYTVVECPVEE